MGGSPEPGEVEVAVSRDHAWATRVKLCLKKKVLCFIRPFTLCYPALFQRGSENFEPLFIFIHSDQMSTVMSTSEKQELSRAFLELTVEHI